MKLLFSAASELAFSILRRASSRIFASPSRPKTSACGHDCFGATVEVAVPQLRSNAACADFIVELQQRFAHKGFPRVVEDTTESYWALRSRVDYLQLRAL